MITGLARVIWACIGRVESRCWTLVTGRVRLTWMMLLLLRTLVGLGRQRVGLALSRLRKVFLGATSVKVRWLVEYDIVTVMGSEVLRWGS